MSFEKDLQNLLDAYFDLGEWDYTEGANSAELNNYNQLLIDAQKAREEFLAYWERLQQKLREADCPNSDSNIKPCINGRLNHLRLDGKFHETAMDCDWCADREELLK